MGKIHFMMLSTTSLNGLVLVKTIFLDSARKSANQAKEKHASHN